MANNVISALYVEADASRLGTEPIHDDVDPAGAAEAVDNKLNVTGGVIEKWTVDSTRDVRVVLVLLTQTQTGEPPNDLEIKLRPPASAHTDPLIIRGPIPRETARGEVGFAIFGIRTRLPFDGRWVIEASAGGNTVPLRSG